MGAPSLLIKRGRGFCVLPELRLRFQFCKDREPMLVAGRASFAVRGPSALQTNFSLCELVTLAERR